MRLIHTLKNQQQALILTNFLTSEGIDNQLEVITNTDWGSDHYGEVTCNLWVYEEGQLAKAKEWVEAFEKHPDDPKFVENIQQISPFIEEIEEIQDMDQTKPESESIKSIAEEEDVLNSAPNRGPKRYVEKSSPITAYLILFCFLLFTSDFLTEPNVTEIVKNLPATPQVSSAIKKTALYDYPKAYELEDKLIKIYGLDKLSQPEELPLPGKQLLQTFYKTPYWKGAYMQFFGKAKNKSGASLPPMFEKLSEGQFWRLISPSFMHYDLLHILFNMLWLFVLGKQLEVRLKAGKYLFLMALLAIFSNTCQYLMSGVDFLGFSGIICGFLTFIWMRQRVAPWEGYPLERTTFNFMMIFIGAMALIQLTSFYLELNHDLSISPGIANTAHLSGALFGAFLARWPVFGWKI